MQGNDVPIAPKISMLTCFQPDGRLLLVKQEPLLSHPSTSVHRKRKKKPISTTEVSGPHLDFNSRLIELIKHRRFLFDGVTPGGRNSSFRIQVWDGLARQLEFNKGGYHLQKRWKHIRDKYVKERRALSEREQESLESEGNSSSWPLFKKMSFLEPFLVQRDPERSTSPFDRSRPCGALSPEETIDFNRRVIAEVRAHPVLYSKADVHYHTTDQRVAAWQAVLAELNYPCDVIEMQRYWKSIRDRYIRIRRSLNDPSDGSCSSGGSSGRERREKKWVHYDDLLWLEPFIELRQRIREEFALARQAADRRRRGIVAVADEEDGVEVDYEVDREEMQTSVLHDAHTVLLESGVRFDGDSAFAASVISDIRALPLEQQAHVRARIELALERSTKTSDVMEKLREMQPEKKRKRKEGEERRGEERGMRSEGKE